MNTSRDVLRKVLYVLFALSGFAGLIYESIWSHYLKLFLGHAAYAQTLVLVIFMGGMTIGAWLAGEWSRRLRHPLLAYVAIEGLLGIAALLFDSLFRGMQAWVFDSAIPGLESPLAIDALKWSLSALIILPQSVLLGATFPLMSAGLVRLDPAIAGSALGWLYFTNSLGAAAGVLVSGFVLIRLVGLPGTILTAGLINFTLALAVWLLLRRTGLFEQPVIADRRAGDPAATPLLLLAASLLTGAASFFYEIGWIRMLSLVLGSATHSFELMLSAFVLGLSLGAFYIRTRIDRTTDPLRLLAWIQMAMGTLALLSLPLYLQTFDAMGAFFSTVQRNAGGYVLFNLFSHGLCLLLMLPVTFCAGMTLPLITATLIRAGHGEASIGRVYAANTLGAITGTVLAVHVVMPMLGLRQVVVAGALVDFGLGLWLLARAGADGSTLRSWRPAAALALVGALSIVAADFDPAVTGSGVFRYGNPRVLGTTLFHQDGKTATVDVRRSADGTVSIATNGKSDAALVPDGKIPSTDDYTMALAGIFAPLLSPQGADVAVIGFGSGRTTHVALSYQRLQSVDTIEIEPAMVEGARQFKGANDLAYSDPRSRIHIEDAKTFFARNGRLYDVIFSEPSNPWVSGVASLFSREFYRQAHRYLKPGGVFIQWLHIYEIDAELVAAVMNAIAAEFEHYEVYATNDFDMLIVAAPEKKSLELSATPLQDPALAAIARHIDINSMADIHVRKLGSKRTLTPLFSAFGVPPNSDYFPILDQGGVQRRFMNSRMDQLLELHPVISRLEPPAAGAGQPLTATHSLAPASQAATAQRVAAFWSGQPSESVKLDPQLAQHMLLLQSIDGMCRTQVWESNWQDELHRSAQLALPYWSAAESSAFIQRLRNMRCYASASRELKSLAALIDAAGSRRWSEVIGHTDTLLQAAEAQKQPPPAWLLREVLLAEYLNGGAAALASRVKSLGEQMPKTVQMGYFRLLAEAQAGS